MFSLTTHIAAREPVTCKTITRAHEGNKAAERLASVEAGLEEARGYYRQAGHNLRAVIAPLLLKAITLRNAKRGCEYAAIDCGRA